jgi:predicted dienelactone hydrolase
MHQVSACMIKPALAILLPLLAALACPNAARSQSPGDTVFKVGLASRRIAPPVPYEWRGATTRALITDVWYPADVQAQVAPQRIGPPGAPIFEADPAAANAELVKSPPRFPLILMSHGTGGTAASMAWLATALAARGFIVAGVDHPGNNAVEAYTVQGFALWWLRARDISMVIDSMLADATFGAHIDPARIGAVGFSLGGYTMIELAGGITSLAQFATYCRATPDATTCKAPPEFPDLRAKSEALAREDAAYAAALGESGRSYREPRIRAVVAIAPALGPAFTPESLAAIAIPVAIIAGESDSIVPIDANAKPDAAKIPHAELTILPGRVDHYVFVNICTSGGRSLLGPICVDAPEIDRAAIHRTTAALAIKFFEDRLR